MIKLRQIKNYNVKIYTNSNHWFNIKKYPNYKNLSPVESPLYEIENNSSKYANSFLLNNTCFLWLFLITRNLC